MLKLPKSFTVDRATWLRGSRHDIALLTEGGGRCCVGFLAKEMGIGDDRLCYRQVLGEVVDDGDPRNPSLPAELRAPSIVGPDLGVIYTTNDSRGISDTAREAKLTELFAAIGIEVRFEGEGNPVSP